MKLRLRTVNKFPPPWKLNKLPESLGPAVGRSIVALLACGASIEGRNWERAFADAIGADWKPSNNGFDDVVLGYIAWSAKSIQVTKPHTHINLRLISGRNDPKFSTKKERSKRLNVLGRHALQIWNERVKSIKSEYKHTRTIVLLKPAKKASATKRSEWLDFAVFEIPTDSYRPSDFYWKANRNGNLEGFSKRTDVRFFTWQHHGAQLTIHHTAPKERLKLRIQNPKLIPIRTLLKQVGFRKSFVKIVR